MSEILSDGLDVGENRDGQWFIHSPRRVCSGRSCYENKREARRAGFALMNAYYFKTFKCHLCNCWHFEGD